MAVRTTTAPAQAHPPECLSANLGWLLSTASQTLATDLAAALERLGLSPRAYCVLATAMRGEHTQTDLARMIGLDKTTLLVTLDELEAAGLARRLPLKTDRRVRVVAVTKAGERTVARAAEVVEGVEADALSALSAPDRRALVDALGRLVADGLSRRAAGAQRGAHAASE